MLSARESHRSVRILQAIRVEDGNEVEVVSVQHLRHGEDLVHHVRERRRRDPLPRVDVCGCEEGVRDTRGARRRPADITAGWMWNI